MTARALQFGVQRQQIGVVPVIREASDDEILEQQCGSGDGMVERKREFGEIEGEIAIDYLDCEVVVFEEAGDSEVGLDFGEGIYIGAAVQGLFEQEMAREVHFFFFFKLELSGS